MQSRVKVRLGYWVIGLMLVFACAARVVNLDADPSDPTWIGYITDEGRWNETARNRALFGTSGEGDVARLHLLLSPAYQAVNYAVFRTVGVGLAEARAFSAISGILMLLTVCLAMRQHVRMLALGLGVAILGFETNMLAQSRMALPEIPSAFLSLLAFLVIVLFERTRRNALLAGVLAAAAVAMKGTFLLVLPVFPLIILVSTRGQGTRERIARVLDFMAGVAVPALGALGAAWALGFVSVDQIVHASSKFGHFVSLAPPYVVAMRVFGSTDLESRNLLLLGAWACSWAWIARDLKIKPVLRELYLMSGLWSIWWLAVWSMNGYAPDRYVSHFIVPATIHLIAGTSLARRGMLWRIGAFLRASAGYAAAARLAWLVLPSSVLIATALFGMAKSGGWDVDRLSLRIAAILVLTAIFTMVLWHRRSDRVIAASIVFPLSATMVWLLGREFGLFRLFWEFDSQGNLGIWIASLVVLVFASLLVTSRISMPSRHAALEAAAVGIFATIFIVQGAGPVFLPTYSIRDTSRELGQLLSSNDEVGVVSAATLLLENKLRYRELWPTKESYEGVVITLEGDVITRAFLKSEGAADLVRVRTFPVSVDPRYHPTPRARALPTASVSIGLYEPR